MLLERLADRLFTSVGCRDAADVIVFASNDDCLFTIGTLQAQDAAVLHAAPADGHDDREDGEPEQYSHET
jgi:hypothetical protein